MDSGVIVDSRSTMGWMRNRCWYYRYEGVYSVLIEWVVCVVCVVYGQYVVVVSNKCCCFMCVEYDVEYRSDLGYLCVKCCLY